MSDLINKMKEYLIENKTSNIFKIKFIQKYTLINTINRRYKEL